MSKDPARCPWCNKWMEVTIQEVGGHQVECCGCDARGPLEATHEEAKHASYGTYTDRILNLPDHARLQVEAILKQYGVGE